MERIYTLGNGVTFDSLKHQIVRNDDVVFLGSREAAILKLLYDHRNEVVNKTKLHDYVWGKVYVSETSLTKAISNLRRSLASFNLSSSEIKTVPKEGYIFIYEEVVDEVKEGYCVVKEQNNNYWSIISQLCDAKFDDKYNIKIRPYFALILSSSILSSLITGVVFFVFDFFV
ncbi:winged helix-turn-helix domain-containing protein [Plesiomonas sp.]|uniref:winged helix-turn-helix domain-containing protein n=1 Tax=Plesiomonas sp. TaxID=2486279 RepID=UPI003F30B4FF